MPSDGTIFPAPRTFFWLPLDGARHAVGIAHRETNHGQPVETLCGQQPTRVPAGDTEWLWPTCSGCWDITTAQAGLRKRPHRPG
jgi:hypothetical protein